MGLIFLRNPNLLLIIPLLHSYYSRPFSFVILLRAFFRIPIFPTLLSLLPHLANVQALQVVISQLLAPSTFLEQLLTFLLFLGLLILISSRILLQVFSIALLLPLLVPLRFLAILHILFIFRQAYPFFFNVQLTALIPIVAALLQFKQQCPHQHFDSMPLLQPSSSSFSSSFLQSWICLHHSPMGPFKLEILQLRPRCYPLIMRVARSTFPRQQLTIQFQEQFTLARCFVQNHNCCELQLARGLFLQQLVVALECLLNVPLPNHHHHFNNTVQAVEVVEHHYSVKIVFTLAQVTRTIACSLCFCPYIYLVLSIRFCVHPMKNKFVNLIQKMI